MKLKKIQRKDVKMKDYKMQIIKKNLKNIQIEKPILDLKKNIQYIIKYKDDYIIASKKLLNQDEIKIFNLKDYEFKPFYNI